MNHLAHRAIEIRSVNKQQQIEAWDLNGDGILQKKEADMWWLNGNGKSIVVDNSKIDWSGLELPTSVEIGKVFSIETHKAFLKLPYETASTYGGTSFRKVEAFKAIVLNQKYHYNFRDSFTLIV